MRQDFLAFVLRVCADVLSFFRNVWKAGKQQIFDSAIKMFEAVSIRLLGRAERLGGELY